MAGKELTNGWTYIIIIFIYALVVGLIHNYVDSQINNPLINLNEENLEFIARIKNINISDYYVTTTNAESNYLDDSGDETGDTTKDNALELFFAQSQGTKIENVIKDIFSLPSFIGEKLLGIPNVAIISFLDILNWLWRFGITFAVYYFIRGLK